MTLRGYLRNMDACSHQAPLRVRGKDKRGQALQQSCLIGKAGEPVDLKDADTTYGSGFAAGEGTAFSIPLYGFAVVESVDLYGVEGCGIFFSAQVVDE